jgi:type I restriction enzyme R subunit
MDKNIDKVIFVVDRKDLDYQTTKEFNSFCNGAVDGTDNTGVLVKQLSGTNKLVITTIQKLTKAIDTERYEHKMGALRDKKIVLIFDECHRSQFGEMHRKITDFFRNIQYFGFTGTPIFSENANKYRTTKNLFGECLHSYLIKDAIRDDNVLGFAVEYVGRYQEKNKNQPDIEVEAIDTKELMESEARLSAITDYIINNHSAKTFRKEFTGIFAVSSVPVLTRYYEMFKSREHNLKIATIFSYNPNEEDGGDEHSRDKLERYIGDYNAMFGTNYSTDTFDEYYVDVAKRVKDKQIDLLLVVNMFLTGFDSKYLNTLYVDKNLKYHGLVQAFSRTNRILNEKKKQGNIVCFRNLKKQVDEAITLYSDENALDTVLMKSYEEYVRDFNSALEGMREITTEVRDVDDLESENEKLEFVKRFRELLRIMNRLSIFTEFDFEDLDIDPQTFEDYRSKYLDLYDSSKERDKVSILDDVDFEIELLRRDDINVNYILNLLKNLNRESSSFEQDRKFILENLEKNVNLRSKRELVEKFIDENLVNVTEENDFETEFDRFLGEEKNMAVQELIEQENLKSQEIHEVFEEFEFSGKLKKDVIKSSFFSRPKLKEMREKVAFIGQKIYNIVEMFTW